MNCDKNSFYSEELLNVDPHIVEDHWSKYFIEPASKEITIKPYQPAAIKIQNLSEDEILLRLNQFDMERQKELEKLIKEISSN